MQEISEKSFWPGKEMLGGESGAFKDEDHSLKTRDADILREEI
jgi:hypothetical protein